MKALERTSQQWLEDKDTAFPPLQRRTIEERLGERENGWAQLLEPESPGRRRSRWRQIGELLQMAKKVGPAVEALGVILFSHIRDSEYVDRVHKGRFLELYDEIERLRDEIAAMRNGDGTGEDPPLRYYGVWKNDRAYTRGDAVTDGGQLWFARSSKPEGRPGRQGSSGWQMMTGGPPRANR